MSKIQELITHWRESNSMIPYIAMLALAAVVTLYFEAEKKPTTVTGAEKEKTIDTFIPLGFVLVPIELANHDALHAIFGKTGTVDLFLPPANVHGRPKLIMSQVRLLRAPKNPHRFAALVPEAESKRLVRTAAALFAVLKNPNQKTAVKIVEERKKKRRIIFNEDD